MTELTELMFSENLHFQYGFIFLLFVCFYILSSAGFICEFNAWMQTKFLSGWWQNEDFKIIFKYLKNFDIFRHNNIQDVKEVHTEKLFSSKEALFSYSHQPVSPKLPMKNVQQFLLLSQLTSVHHPLLAREPRHNKYQMSFSQCVTAP